MNIQRPDLVPTAEPVAELDRVGDEIAELSAHIEAAMAHLLDLIREFDARGGWGNGFRTCAHWLSWRIGLDLGAARERVRVARALPMLPRLAQALACGELSYAKVRALTRVATPEIEERLLAVGKAGTAEHVERIVRGWRRVDRKAEARETAKRHTSRALHVYQDEDGMVVIRGRLAPEVGALLVQALAAAREKLYQQAEVSTFDTVLSTHRRNISAKIRATRARRRPDAASTGRSWKTAKPGGTTGDPAADRAGRNLRGGRDRGRLFDQVNPTVHGSNRRRDAATATTPAPPALGR